MNDLITPLRRYADFRGRSDRAEFWSFMLFLAIGWLVFATIDQMLGFGHLDRSWQTYNWGMAGMADWNGGFLSVMFWLGMLIPTIAVAVRRLHDANHGGGWLLLFFVPVIGWLVLLIFYTQATWPVVNQWGPPRTL
ncbi:DUF805 domain-containing protein [Sphingomonas sp. AP4-R1]|uniref:DUF805 domain-containing protein n=1 Tax=Sphingomonas sp. AP4-R1 TaxID=2735134 RepID=UPI0014939133|nr:DUF805 domain-containing protein [Sphingomonas sp. AP4-R1]QJU58937.1 DUF805 domain-containing protein [Sphingomonas sp. AP4-R1]